MIQRMCGTCEQERDKLIERIAELEARVASLTNTTLKFQYGTLVNVLPRSPDDTHYGLGVIVGCDDYCGAVEYRVTLDDHPGDHFWVREHEVTHR